MFLTNVIISFKKNRKLFNHYHRYPRCHGSGTRVTMGEDKLTLIRTSRNTLGRNINFVLSNDKLLEKEDLFFQIYMFLITNNDFLEFGEHKVIIVNGKIKNETFNLPFALSSKARDHNILVKNNTSFEAY